MNNSERGKGRALDIGVFAEFYPNMFKTYIDWQIIELIRQGHKLTIYAHGAWDEIIDPEVIQNNLLEKIVYYPSTIKHIPRSIFSAKSPKMHWSAHLIKKVWNHNYSFKKNIVIAFRTASLQSHHDVCLINDLATASHFTFIKKIFPSSCVAVYFHGTPLPGVYSGYMKDKDLIFSVSDLVFTPTDYSKKILQSLNCPEQKIRVIPVGLNLSKFNIYKKKFYKKNNILRILSVARLSPEKGFDFAIEAIDILVKKGYNFISYTIIGSGPQQKILYDKVNELGLNGIVSMVGVKTNTEVLEYLAESDVFVLPSVPFEGCSENQGTVIQEAQAMNIPVITTAVGGLPEGFLDGQSGFMVPPFNSQAIAEKLIDFISLSPADFRVYGEKGRRFIESKYAIENTVGEMIFHITNFLAA